MVECVPEKVVRKVKYTEMVPYQETIRVAVAPRARPASADRGHGRMFGGLFRRGCGH